MQLLSIIYFLIKYSHLSHDVEEEKLKSTVITRIADIKSYGSSKHKNKEETEHNR